MAKVAGVASANRRPRWGLANTVAIAATPNRASRQPRRMNSAAPASTTAKPIAASAPNTSGRNSGASRDTDRVGCQSNGHTGCVCIAGGSDDSTPAVATTAKPTTASAPTTPRRDTDRRGPRRQRFTQAIATSVPNPVSLARVTRP